EVLREVVAVLGPGRLVDVVIVLDELGEPLVRFAADEAVEAVIAEPPRPIALRAADVERIDRHVVILADPERAPARVAQHARHRRALLRDVAAVAREADSRIRERAAAA